MSHGPARGHSGLWAVACACLLGAVPLLARADEPGPAAAPTSPPAQATPAAQASPTPSAETRIKFKRGAIQAVTRGRLSGMKEELRFVVRARAGQTMRVWVEAPGPTRGLVRFPGGDTDGGPGPVFFEDMLPEEGDYRISITESSMGRAWQGEVTLHVRIK